MSDGTGASGGLGWPGASSGPREFSTGLGWPGERVPPQEEPTSPQATEAVEAPADEPVSRETSALAGGRVRTAADLSELAVTVHDETTPLARAAEHSVLARMGARARVAMPRPASTR